jgi:hypothetical protein
MSLVASLCCQSPHKKDSKKTPREERHRKVPLEVPLKKVVEVDLQYFHRHCYKSSPLWFLV